MNNISKSILAILVLALIGAGIFWLAPDSQEQAGDLKNIIGCYVSRTGRDVYTLSISEQDGEEVYGKLSFDNYQKDSSSGTFDGVYKDGILLGEYAFRSEGMDSVMQVAFQKRGDGFVRGYGEMNSEGTEFVDPSAIKYDASSSLNVFKKEKCAEEVSYKTYSSEALGLEFKYRQSPDGYVLSEQAPDQADRALGLVGSLILLPEKDAGYETPVGGEFPPAITIRVFKNENKEWPVVWAESNNRWSNINLKQAEPVEYAVGGAKAVRYPADGLYATDNIVATHGDFAYVITGAYMDEASEIKQDFLPLVESIKFIPASR